MIAIPRHLLPEDPEGIMDVLEDYFAFDRLPMWEEVDDQVQVRLVPPPRGEFYVDPRLDEGLEWWGGGVAIENIPDLKGTRGALRIGMNDAWTLWSWSLWLSDRARRSERPGPVCVLHADDHEDLMSPRVIAGPEGMIDPITGESVIMTDPESVSRAITSGAIGMGSFIVPFLSHVPNLHVRHLRADGPEQPATPMTVGVEPDSLLRPGADRLVVRRDGPASEGSYCRTADARSWAEVPEDCSVLLHIDLDYFNNRYDGDSDWRNRSRQFDPAPGAVEELVDSMIEALEASGAMSRVEDVFIGISPGFFPAELWATTVDRLTEGLGQAGLR
jgi:hypothetical protein